MSDQPNVTLVCPDLSTNCLGRTLLLAELTEPRFRPQIVGLRLGSKIWSPAVGSRIPIRELALRSVAGWPAAVRWFRRVAKDTRVVVTKPLATSLGLALSSGVRPPETLMDNDDWEFGLRRTHGPRTPLAKAAELFDPKAFNGLASTALLEHSLVSYDHRTVSNTWLQQRFGGVVLPHVRDTSWLDPSKLDRAALRARFGLGDKQWVGFIGTPRSHKGTDELVEAARLAGPSVGVFIAGLDVNDKYAAEFLKNAKRRLGEDRLSVHGPFPFSELPTWVAAPDIVALPSRDEPGAWGQIPAKLFDAMAMAKPIVVTEVNDMGKILGDAGLRVPPGDVQALATALKRLTESPDLGNRLGEAARELAVRNYSYEAGRRTLNGLLEKVATFRAR
ncbi:MAG: glycosyltransferase [Polyangiaceae bacterium]